MTAFADTNWVVATYFVKAQDERTAMVDRFMRRHGQPLVISHVVLLECVNVFAWTAQQQNSVEWQNLQSELGWKFLVDSMDWDLLWQKTTQLCNRYSHRGKLGTFDLTLVASALLAGAQMFLSFDSQCRAIANAERLKVFPEPFEREKGLRALLR